MLEWQQRILKPNPLSSGKTADTSLSGRECLAAALASSWALSQFKIDLTANFNDGSCRKLNNNEEDPSKWSCKRPDTFHPKRPKIGCYLLPSSSYPFPSALPSKGASLLSHLSPVWQPFYSLAMYNMWFDSPPKRLRWSGLPPPPLYWVRVWAGASPSSSYLRSSQIPFLCTLSAAAVGGV